MLVVNAEKTRKDYAFQRQFDEKPSITLGCPAGWPCKLQQWQVCCAAVLGLCNVSNHAHRQCQACSCVQRQDSIKTVQGLDAKQ